MTVQMYNDIVSAALACLNDINVSCGRVFRLIRLMSEETEGGNDHVGNLRRNVSVLLKSVDDFQAATRVHKPPNDIPLLYSPKKMDADDVLRGMGLMGFQNEDGVYKQEFSAGMYTAAHEVTLMEEAYRVDSKYTVAQHTRLIWKDLVERAQVLEPTARIFLHFRVPREIRAAFQKALLLTKTFFDTVQANTVVALH